MSKMQFAAAVIAAGFIQCASAATRFDFTDLASADNADSNGGTAVLLSGDPYSTCSAESFIVNLSDINYFILESGSLAASTYLADLEDVATVPLPAATWLPGSALAGPDLPGRGRSGKTA